MSKPFILYSKFTGLTGRRLRDGLGIDGGRSFDPNAGYTHLIRWGTSNDPPLDDDVRVVYNPASNIAQVANRHHMFQALRRTTNRVPRFSSNMLIPDPNLSRSNVVARHRFGKWGRDIVRFRSGDRINANDPKWDGYFLVEKWLGDFEVRVHIVNGNSVAFQVKVRKDSNDQPLYRLEDESAKFTIRNTKNGWFLWPLSSDQATSLGITKAPLRDLARQITERLGFTSLAVDFLVRVPEGHHGDTYDYRVLEVNSAPGLEGTTLSRYVGAYQEILEKSGDGVDETSEMNGDPELMALRQDSERLLEIRNAYRVVYDSFTDGPAEWDPDARRRARSVAFTGGSVCTCDGCQRGADLLVEWWDLIGRPDTLPGEERRRSPSVRFRSTIADNDDLVGTWGG